MTTGAIIGQSLGEHLASQTTTGLTPLASTSMYSGGWVTPANSMIQFCNELRVRTNREVKTLNLSVGGSALQKECAAPGTAYNHWQNRVDSNSPLVMAKAAIAASGGELDWVWCINGQQEAWNPQPVATSVAAYVALQAEFAAMAGKLPKDLPFILSPVGNSSAYSLASRQILVAQILACEHPGFVLGPDYWDLATSDGTHHAAVERNTLATRGAQAIAKVIGVDPTPFGGGAMIGDVVPFTLDVSTAGNQDVPVPFEPTMVIFFGAFGSAGDRATFGVDTGNAGSIYANANGNPGQFSAYSWPITLRSTSTSWFCARIVSKDSSKITLEKWHSATAPSGTIQMYAALVR